MMTFGYFDSPIGLVEIGASDDAVTSLYFVDGRRPRVTGNAVAARAVEQVTAYFTGALREFDLPLELHGTDFQRLVWERLASIPFGETTSYGELAGAIARPAAVRAVGAANGANPISIILPCHRVVGSDGSLTGYGGGLWRKEWLLRHEGSRLL
ncbi:MAG: methylated-DNA--[protein]-cysteine S-methyltransferase [Candidatus Eisenbacteria bacterium]